MNRNDIEDYLETLAESHVALQHSATRKTFYRMTAEEGNAVATNAASPRLQVESYGGRYTGSPEGLDKVANLVLKVLVKAATVSEAARQQAYNEAEAILDDIIAKLAEQSIDGCFPLSGIIFNSIAFDKVGPEGQNDFGYRVTIPIRQSGPVFNPTKWQ